MRTTLTIDDDVLSAARDVAARQHRTLGEVISDWSRQALRPADVDDKPIRNGVPLLSRRAGTEPVTLEIVNRLRDELA